MKITKRDGRVVEYDGIKIVQAVSKAMKETTGIVNSDLCYLIEEEVKKTLLAGNYPFTVEGIQDSVENSLMSIGNCNEVAKAYILYRDERNKQRDILKTKVMNKYKYLDYDFLKQYMYKNDPFTTQLGKVVYYRTYSRPIPEEGRRERWWETVARVVNYSSDLEVLATKREKGNIHPNQIDGIKKQAKEIFDLMYNLKLFPSGRSLWVGGTQSSYDNPISNFNCSFLIIDDIDKFSEMFMVLMLGTGVGLSVENKYIKRLPKVNSNIDIIHKDYTPVQKNNRTEFTQIKEISKNTVEIIIGDSKTGWSSAIKYYLDILTQKNFKEIELILLNYDNIRQAGEPLLTFGGTASGHIAIKTMFSKIDKVFKTEKTRQNGGQWVKLKPINALDIATSIAENVVSGGKI